jgi:phage terminase large subunit-like protein
MWAHYPELFPLRNGRPTKPRYANGQEEIRLTNGGIYSIVAPSRGGARGPSRDLVIIDELREMEAWDFIAAAKPTMTASTNPQMLYLSNAGEETSIVLNALRDRRETDPNLCYLEWSADPERRSDDPDGWSEANPAMGNEPEGMGSVYATLVADHQTAVLEGTMALFETEHLCRWVVTTRRRLVDEFAWNLCEGETTIGKRPAMGVSMDPSGTRASVAVAWLEPDGTVGLRMIREGTGAPIATDILGNDIKSEATRLRVVNVGYDPMTDAELAKYPKRAEGISGAKFANATAQFVNLVGAGKIRWTDCASITDDLVWTARKEYEDGHFQAVRANDDRPITAALAAIRAVWLASGNPQPVPKVY